MITGNGFASGSGYQPPRGNRDSDQLGFGIAAGLRLLCAAVLIWIAVFSASPVRAQELSVPADNATLRIFHKIQDLERLQRNIEECYQAETRSLTVAFLSGSPKHVAELDGELVARVFEHLAGSPEHKRFLEAYDLLAQEPDRRVRHSAELYQQYVRLLESSRTRLINQLREGQDRLTEANSTQPVGQNALAQPSAGRTTMLAQSSHTNGSANGRTEPAGREGAPEWLRTFW